MSFDTPYISLTGVLILQGMLLIISNTSRRFLPNSSS